MYVQAENLRETCSVKLSKHITTFEKAYKSCDENILGNILQLGLEMC
jgi:hypothetical protein